MFTQLNCMRMEAYLKSIHYFDVNMSFMRIYPRLNDIFCAQSTIYYFSILSTSIVTVPCVVGGYMSQILDEKLEKFNASCKFQNPNSFMIEYVSNENLQGCDKFELYHAKS